MRDSSEMFHRLRYLLLQVRNCDDPMRSQEVSCFARALRCAPEQIGTWDLLQRAPAISDLDKCDVVLLGGSGDYSVAEGGTWLEPALEAMRELDQVGKPTFASCWGFQAMARALGGRVVTDLTRAELGTVEVHLSAAGEQDPVFSPVGRVFEAQMGHQDIVDALPRGAVLLASSVRVRNQAFRLENKPIYCTQFHPELDRAALIERARAYPRYVETIAGISLQEFVDRCRDTPMSEALLPRFIEHVFG